MAEENECFEQELEVTKRVIAEQMATIKGLLEEIERLQRKPSAIHNERGAGRKRIANDEQASQVLMLHSEGCSLSQIAKELNVSWNKGTVKNIIDRAKVNNQAGAKYVIYDGKLPVCIYKRLVNFGFHPIPNFS